MIIRFFIFILFFALLRFDKIVYPKPFIFFFIFLYSTINFRNFLSMLTIYTFPFITKLLFLYTYSS